MRLTRVKPALQTTRCLPAKQDWPAGQPRCASVKPQTVLQAKQRSQRYFDRRSTFCLLNFILLI